MGQFQQGSSDPSGKGGGSPSGKGGSNPATSGQAQMGAPNLAATSVVQPNNPVTNPPAVTPSPTSGGGKSATPTAIAPAPQSKGSSLQSQPGFGSTPAFGANSPADSLSKSSYLTQLAAGNTRGSSVQQQLDARSNVIGSAGSQGSTDSTVYGQGSLGSTGTSGAMGQSLGMTMQPQTGGIMQPQAIRQVDMTPPSLPQPAIGSPVMGDMQRLVGEANNRVIQGAPSGKGGNMLAPPAMLGNTPAVQSYTPPAVTPQEKPPLNPEMRRRFGRTEN